jgi:hypothetical protein
MHHRFELLQPFALNRSVSFIVIECHDIHFLINVFLGFAFLGQAEHFTLHLSTPSTKDLQQWLTACPLGISLALLVIW